MLRSLLSAVSGLESHQLEMDVIGNNIANLNTIGFKTSRVTFQELMAQTIRGGSRATANSGGTNPVQIGLGTSLASVDSLFNQGQLLTTGRSTDLAIEGEGFFLLGAGGNKGFTRAGSFNIGGDGRLVAANGYVVQGRMADANGVIAPGGVVTDVVVPLGRVAPAVATTHMGLSGNLDSRETPVGTIASSRQLLAVAQTTDDVSRLRDGSGSNAALSTGDRVVLTANASPTTRVVDLTNADGERIDLVDGMNLTVQDGTTTANLVFDDSWTWADFAGQLQSTLRSMGTETDITVGVQSDGSLLFTNPIGGTGQDLTVSVSNPGAPNFNQIVSNVVAANGGLLGNSQRAYYRQELTAGSDFSTLGELATSLQQQLQHVSSGVNVTLANGQITVDNAGPSALNDLSISESGTAGGFTFALDMDGVDIASGASRASGDFLDVAEGNDLLTNLRNLSGQPLSLATGDIITVNGSLGGSAITPVRVSVAAGDGTAGDGSAATLGGLSDELGTILSLGSGGSVVTDADGQLVVNGDPGTDQAISGLTMSADRLGVTVGPEFAEAMRFTQSRAAADVTHATSLEAYDSLGNTHVVTLTFTKDALAQNEWHWQASVGGGASVVGGGQGLATFGDDGTLLSFTSDDGNPLRIDPASGATNPMEINLNPFNADGTGALTQYAFADNAAISTRDGHAMGFLESISVGSDGTVNGVFTNGVSQALARIVLVSFTNPAGLLRTRDGLYVETASSGTPVTGDAGIEMGRTISAGTLEASNVDLATELATMIAAQRGFQANARTITTSDEMLADVINLKR